MEVFVVHLERDFFANETKKTALAYISDVEKRIFFFHGPNTFDKKNQSLSEYAKYKKIPIWEILNDRVHLVDG